MARIRKMWVESECIFALLLHVRIELLILVPTGSGSLNGLCSIPVRDGCISLSSLPILSLSIYWNNMYQRASERTIQRKPLAGLSMCAGSLLRIEFWKHLWEREKVISANDFAKAKVRIIKLKSMRLDKGNALIFPLESCFVGQFPTIIHDLR